MSSRAPKGGIEIDCLDDSNQLARLKPETVVLPMQD